MIKKNMNPFESLPTELIVEIFSHLSGNDFYDIAMVCKLFASWIQFTVEKYRRYPINKIKQSLDEWGIDFTNKKIEHVFVTTTQDYLPTEKPIHGSLRWALSQSELSNADYINILFNPFGSEYKIKYGRRYFSFVPLYLERFDYSSENQNKVKYYFYNNFNLKNKIILIDGSIDWSSNKTSNNSSNIRDYRWNNRYIEIDFSNVFPEAHNVYLYKEFPGFISMQNIAIKGLIISNGLSMIYIQGSVLCKYFKTNPNIDIFSRKPMELFKYNYITFENIKGIYE